ncbi:MAG: hypothetical protein VW959_05725 [Aquiluna sp.]|jgi:hypothetical protein
MPDKPKPDLEKLWKRVGLALFVLAIIVVAGPQIIDLFFPDFR